MASLVISPHFLRNKSAAVPAVGTAEGSEALGSCCRQQVGGTPAGCLAVPMTVSCSLQTEACKDSRIGGMMKTLLLFVGLLLTWESGQVLGDQTVSDNELQGE